MKYVLYVATMACLLAACHAQHPAIYSQGVLVDYEDAGQGDTTLLLSPGWCISKDYWASQVAYFSKRYRVVAITLPGFGASGKNATSYSTEAYGHHLQAVITQLHLKNVVLVGHSMSGNIIVETAAQNDKHIIGLVGVDNFKSVGDSSTPAQDSATTAFYAQARADYKGTMPQFAYYLFAPQTDTTVRARVMQDILRADPKIAMDALQAGDSYDGIKKLASLHKRLYLINSDYTPTDTAGLHAKGIAVRLLTVHGTGHYPMIEAPTAFNAQLEAVLQDIGAAVRH